jgi:hypothetical protein
MARIFTDIRIHQTGLKIVSITLSSSVPFREIRGSISEFGLMSGKRENDSFLYFFPRKIRLGDGERNEAGWPHGSPYSPESG